MELFFNRSYAFRIDCNITCDIILTERSPRLFCAKTGLFLRTTDFLNLFGRGFYSLLLVLYVWGVGVGVL